MDKIRGLLQRLQRDTQDNVTSTQRLAVENLYAPQLTQINDSVYSLHCPHEGKRPSVEIVLFHGLQLEGSHDPYITSWVSRSQSNPELWVKWILEDEKLEDARILLISYDAHVRRTNEEGRMGMHNISENLILDLIYNAQVGQDGCPVILVGHCLGGLLMKELCVQAHMKVGLGLEDKINHGVQNFLANVQGFFCYGSPHHGTELANISTFSEGPLFKGLTTLNDEAERRNENFRTLRQKETYGWRTFGIGESVPVKLGKFKDLIVEEASARYDMDDYLTEAADHFNVCRPKSRNSSIFLLLKNFVSEVVEKMHYRKQLQYEFSGKLVLFDIEYCQLLGITLAGHPWQDIVRQGPTLKIPDNVVGLETQRNTIRHKLFAKGVEKGVQRLGIVGIGGIGKSTLAKEVFNAILGYFDYTCFLMEVKKMNPDSLRDEVKGRLCFRGRRVNEAFKWSDLKGKRVLIVLDDITDDSHVQVITEDENFLSSQKCTVIVTARDKGLFDREHFDFHLVEMLEYEDSKKLFCRHAFEGAAICYKAGQQFVIPEPYETLVESFLGKCDGLPLAIQLVGKYLKKRSLQVWDDALKKLGRHPLDGKATDELMTIVKMCYDDLAPIEQEMFLDVAHCFHGHNLSTVKRTWQMCGCESSESGWDNLLDKGLVTEVLLPTWWDAEGESRYVIQMHELLREHGRSKTCPDPQSGSGCSQRTTPILKIGFDDLAIDVFKEAGGLRNLFRDSGRSPGEDHLIPNQSLFLKVKHLHRWISRLFISERETLRLEIKECKYLLLLPRSIGHFQKLEHLTIANCANLEAVPASVGFLSNLKDLTIQDCGSLSALPESLGDLKGLQRLTIHGCGSLHTLPESLWRLEFLEYLAIEECHGLEALPLSLGQLPALKELKILECSHLQTLPGSIGDLPALQHLIIQGCCDLEALPKSLGKLRVLEYLMIDKCHRLEKLPLNLGELPALKHLEISDCRGLNTLPASIPLLPALQRLTVRECYQLESLPESLGQLRSLQHLTLEGCWNLVSLPDSLWQLRGLRQLTIKCCQVLKSLLWTFGFLDDLERVTIQECESLRFLPYGWPGALEEQPGCHVTIEGCPIEDLQALKHLTVQSHYLEHLPMSIGNLQHLEHLTIQKCQCLKVLPESIQKLEALTNLSIEECPSLEHLPENIGGHTLKYLTIQRCQNLKELPKSIGEALEHLTIQECQKLKRLPKDIGRRTLKYLTIQRCQNLEELPESMGHLRALELLTIQECQKLEELPDSVGHLRSLQHLTIEWCHNLVALPGSLGLLTGLRWLTISSCQGVESFLKGLKHQVDTKECERLRFLPIGCTVIIDGCPIEGCPTEDHQDLTSERRRYGTGFQFFGPESLASWSMFIGQVPTCPIQHSSLTMETDLEDLSEIMGRPPLKYLKIQRSQNLKELPKSIGDLQALEYLKIVECQNLKELPKSIGDLQALEYLTIQECQNLKELPDSVGHLRSLQHLTIEWCHNLVALPESLGLLTGLRWLTISSCQGVESFLKGLKHQVDTKECERLRFLPIGCTVIIDGCPIEGCPTEDHQDLRHLTSERQIYRRASEDSITKLLDELITYSRAHEYSSMDLVTTMDDRWYY